jgi:heptose I phosphotransferase
VKLILNPPFDDLWQGKDPFEQAFAIDGENYRDMGDRKTARFEVGGKAFFIKTHAGVGRWEIIKNLLFLRLPVVGATNEYKAIKRLEELGVATMEAVAFGRTGMNPASQKSFLITAALEPTQALDEFVTEEKLKALGVPERRALVKKLATISRTLHDNGVNHRDFYLCHFLMDTSAQAAVLPPSQRTIYLIDLHRVQLRKRVPGRWRRKDLAALWYSARLVGFGLRDALCFLQAYEAKPLGESFKNVGFWRKVAADADRLHEKGQRKGYHD